MIKPLELFTMDFSNDRNIGVIANKVGEIITEVNNIVLQKPTANTGSIKLPCLDLVTKYIRGRVHNTHHDVAVDTYQFIASQLHAGTYRRAKEVSFD